MKDKSPAGTAYIERTAGAEVERLRSGGPVECVAGSLPNWARGAIHPNALVIVTAEGTVELAEPSAPALSIVSSESSESSAEENPNE